MANKFLISEEKLSLWEKYVLLRKLSGDKIEGLSYEFKVGYVLAVESLDLEKEDFVNYSSEIKTCDAEI